MFLTTVSAVAVSGFGLDKDGQRSDVDEEPARKYLEYLENEVDRRANRASLARWGYTSNITEENLKNQVRKYDKFTVSFRVSVFIKPRTELGLLITIYLLTYLLTYLLHGAESFLSSQLVCR